MGGNRAGGLKVREKNLASNPDYYKVIGKAGGKAYHSKPRGFAAMSKKKVSAAGRKGGVASRRGPQK